MRALRFVLGDQLSFDVASLRNADKNNDLILMCEVLEEAKYVKHHPKKIAFIFSAMRHFAKELEQNDYQVKYLTLDDPDNQGSVKAQIEHTLKSNKYSSLHLTMPGEYRLLEVFEFLKEKLEISVEIHEDDRFLCSHTEFKQWIKGRKTPRMEYFYREMRKKYNILLNEDEPVGGEWNYDEQNRAAPDEDLQPKERLQHYQDDITKDVLSLVEKEFSNHFGDLAGFNFAVTRRQAENTLDNFIENHLPQFGKYQDAMVDGEPFLNHSVLSFYINVGLLNPLEVCQKAEQAYHDNKVPLNACEGFIRQILGWREFIRGIYWHYMPEYAEKNHFDAKRPLPDFYWGADTKMRCIKEVVRMTKEEAYSHHIQRLMVTGNFALLAGLSPKEVCEWYLAVYADAFEWVELPNTLGMALFGDGGAFASKPYCASGKYINRMSNFCKNCEYQPEKTTEDNACPFNSLYWHFLSHNRTLLKSNPRLNLTYSNWDRMKDDRKNAILDKAKNFLDQLK